MKKYIVGVDIGGTKTAILLAPLSENINKIQVDSYFIDRLEFSTPIEKEAANGVKKIIESIYEILDKNETSKEDIVSIGISCGGPLDTQKGIILHPPNLLGWNNVYIVDILSMEFNTSVKIQNDANAGALAEWMFGAGKGSQNLVFLTMGTGMGAGLILNGKLYSGTNDMAGEIGHIRLSENGPVGYGKEGSFESFCGGSGIAQVGYSKALTKLQVGETTKFCKRIEDYNKVTAKTIGDAAEKGDITAIETYEKVGTYLGKGLSILIDILNPEKIIIGGIFTKSNNLLEKTMQKEIKKESLGLSQKVCKVVPCQLNGKIGDFATIAVALYSK